MTLLRAILCCGFVLWVGCSRRVQTPFPEFEAVELSEAMHRLPTHVQARESWARAILAALEQNRLHASLPAYCSVVAVVAQESNFEPNPKVAGLPRLVRQRLEEDAGKFGPLGRVALDKLLQARRKGSTLTFDQRIARLKTERDVDVLFRDLLGYTREEFPATFAAANVIGQLFSATALEDLNPITTAGSMQVSVRFAQEWAEAQGRKEEVRETLYTLEGGLYYGVGRLLSYEASYEDTLYRFADYNAGLYASRNAAFQEAVRRLVGGELVLDGDLLAYDRHARPLDKETRSQSAILRFRDRYFPNLSSGRIRDDLLLEKSPEFEQTPTYRAVRRIFQDRAGTPAPYARLPEVAIRSVKMTRDRSTAWFAKSVQAHFQACASRVP